MRSGHTWSPIDFIELLEVFRLRLDLLVGKELRLELGSIVRDFLLIYP